MTGGPVTENFLADNLLETVRGSFFVTGPPFSNDLTRYGEGNVEAYQHYPGCRRHGKWPNKLIITLV